MISTNATLQNKEIAMKATIMQQENKIVGFINIVIVLLLESYNIDVTYK